MYDHGGAPQTFPARGRSFCAGERVCVCVFICQPHLTSPPMSVRIVTLEQNDLCNPPESTTLQPHNPTSQAVLTCHEPAMRWPRVVGERSDLLRRLGGRRCMNHSSYSIIIACKAAGSHIEHRRSLRTVVQCSHSLCCMAADCRKLFLHAHHVRICTKTVGMLAPVCMHSAATLGLHRASVSKRFLVSPAQLPDSPLHPAAV